MIASLLFMLLALLEWLDKIKRKIRGEKI